MYYVEEEIESVEVMGVKEKFKHISPNAREGCSPHC